MRKKLNAILVFLIISSDIVIGKESNKTKTHKTNNKKQNSVKEKIDTVRLKRSIDDDDGRPFWGNRGKKQIDDESYFNTKYDNVLEKTNKFLKERDNVEKEPFWGTRGRRDSSSAETYEDSDVSYENSNCKYCYSNIHKYDQGDINFKDRREDRIMPFWGNRGRRSSDEDDSSEPFWGNRGRRQEDDPFWGTRGRRKESALRGDHERGEDEPFWGNRGRREEQEPFWGNRGRRQDSEPFWGTRGRRQETEPFWGTRGRRDEEPFWGNRGRRTENEDVFWGSRGRRKENLKESIMEAINNVENDIEHLSRLRRSESTFWSNRGRDSKLNYLFNGPARNKPTTGYLSRNIDLNLKPAEPGTVHDSRIYAEEPHYIVVERSSRSSAEEDPFFISRGKKYYFNYNLVKAARDRRGAIEEIVKSVKNDPYFIARGKKDTETNENTTLTDEEFVKVKELICSAIDLISTPKEKGKVKREIDSDRDRRTILKKLAAQLQIDPYYVSRGKKSDVIVNDDNLGKFITDIAKKCV